MDIFSTVVQTLTAFAALTLAFIGLRMNARPGIRVRVRRHGKPVVFAPGEEGAFTIYVELRGFFYGKPAATDVKLTVNVADSWGLKHLSWSSPGISESAQVAQGKGLRSRPPWIFWHRLPDTGPSNYLVAEHLWLTRHENGETLTAILRAPEKPGDYLGWIHADSKQGDCGVHVFELSCRNG